MTRSSVQSHRPNRRTFSALCHFTDRRIAGRRTRGSTRQFALTVYGTSFHRYLFSDATKQIWPVVPARDRGYARPVASGALRRRVMKTSLQTWLSDRWAAGMGSAYWQALPTRSMVRLLA